MATEHTPTATVAETWNLGMAAFTCFWVSCPESLEKISKASKIARSSAHCADLGGQFLV
jgi:hypothetical protein